MARKAILFDLDGTLVDSIACYEDALRQALLEVGVPEFTHEQFIAGYHQGQHLTHILESLGRTDVDQKAVRARRDVVYLEHLRERSEWIEGAEALLNSCRERHRLGLITGSWRSYVDVLDTKLRLCERFEIVITCDDMGKFQKPHPHGILMACTHLNIEPSEAIYVGDQQFDIDAARAAGMEAHAVRGPLSPAQFEGARVHDVLGALEAYIRTTN